jgi:tungstate transport system ATP-binding protein
MTDDRRWIEGRGSRIEDRQAAVFDPRSSTRDSQDPEEPIYRLEEITLRYGERLVLDIPLLEVRRGESLAIVGPSGAGKSSLLRLLNFLEPPTSGTITFQGRTLGGRAAAPLDLRRQVTTVFQRPAPLSTSVLDNVAYGLRLRGAPQARERAAAALARLGLARLAGKPARTLSGGELQRVALARALVIEPQVLLLDEPTANLDLYNAQQIEQALADLHAQGVTTIVLVTHNIFQARRIGQRAALLLEGQIVEITDVQAFFESPGDARTAAFVRGDMIY